MTVVYTNSAVERLIALHFLSCILAVTIKVWLSFNKYEYFHHISLGLDGSSKVCSSSAPGTRFLLLQAQKTAYVPLRSIATHILFKPVLSLVVVAIFKQGESDLCWDSAECTVTRGFILLHKHTLQKREKTSVLVALAVCVWVQKCVWFSWVISLGRVLLGFQYC